MKKQKKKYHFISIENPPKGVKIKGDGNKMQLNCSVLSFSLIFGWSMILVAAALGFYFSWAFSAVLSLFLLVLILTALYFIITNALGEIVMVIHNDLLIVNEKRLFSDSGFDIKLSSVESARIYSWRETISVGRTGRPQSYLHEEMRIKTNKGRVYAFGNGMNSEALWFLLFVIEKKMEQA